MENILLEKALSQAEKAEVYRESFQNTTVSFNSNRLKSIDNSFGEGTGLRVIKDGKIGFSHITTSQNLDFLIQSAIESTNFGQPAFFEFPSASRAPRVKCFDEDVASLPVEKMVKEGEKAIKTILEQFPSFQCEVEVDKTVATTSILNSSGVDFSYKKTFYALSIYAFLAEEGDFLGIAESTSSRRYGEWSNLVAQKIIEKADLAQKRASMETGGYPVVFTPKAVPLILGLLKRGVNGKFVQKKISPLSSKLNTKVTSPTLSITDDATFPYAKASRPIDAEGVSSRKNTIIEKGVLKNFVFDLQTAGITKKETTANAARGYDSMPSPSTSNFIVAPGKLSYQDMVKDIKEGLIVDQVIGAGQSNVLMGEFSVNLDLGYKIKDGNIKGRVKNVMATGNIYELLKNIAGVGKKAEFVGSTCTPALYFTKVNVAG